MDTISTETVLKLKAACDTLRQNLNQPFDLATLVVRFKAKHPSMDVRRCNIYVGAEHESLCRDLAGGGMTFDTVPVTIVPGAVGAMMLPPNYAKEQETNGTKGKQP